MQPLNRDELKRLNETEDFVLINVLPRDKFNQQHIRTSINVPIESDDFVEVVDTVAGSRDRKIVVYCANFECTASAEAANRLEQAGFSNIFDYEGGTRDWFEQKQAA